MNVPQSDDSNTVTEQSSTPKNPIKGSKPFKKGDPRINRKGRPKSFDALRALAQDIGAETVLGVDGKPIVISGHIATRAEGALRSLLAADPEKFLQFAYGKVPNPVELTGKDGAPLEWREVAKANGISQEQIEAAAREFIAKLNRAGGDGNATGASEAPPIT